MPQKTVSPRRRHGKGSPPRARARFCPKIDAGPALLPGFAVAADPVMTPNRRPRFLALASSRGSTRKPPPALRTALGDDLLVVPAKTRPGTVAPDDTDRAAARQNLIRKQRQLPRLFGQPWVERLYLAHKARQSARLRRMLAGVLASHPGILPVIWNGTQLPQSALAAATDPGWRLFMENGYFRGTMQIDPKGVNVHNSLPRDPEFYRGYATVHKAVQESPELIRRQTKHTTHRAVDLPANYVFVPFQIDSDMQITELSPWISSMRDFHDVLVAGCGKRDGPVLVIKEHPGSRHTLHDRVPRHPRIVFQNGRDTRRTDRRRGGGDDDQLDRRHRGPVEGCQGPGPGRVLLRRAPDGAPRALGRGARRHPRHPRRLGARRRGPLGLHRLPGPRVPVPVRPVRTRISRNACWHCPPATTGTSCAGPNLPGRRRAARHGELRPGSRSRNRGFPIIFLP